MEQQDIVCCKCGKYILTEQKQKETSNTKCIKGRYEDGCYDETRDEFYCKECAKKLVKLYNVGDKLRCTEMVRTDRLEMTNPLFDIKVGDIYIITDKGEAENGLCYWYELTAEDNKGIVLNAWNDYPSHRIIDERFEVI